MTHRRRYQGFWLLFWFSVTFLAVDITLAFFDWPNWVSILLFGIYALSVIALTTIMKYRYERV